MSDDTTMTPEHLRGRLLAHRVALRLLISMVPGGISPTSPLATALREEFQRETRLSPEVRAGVAFELDQMLRPP